MSGTVLGKRIRSAADSADATCSITRAKRRVVVNEPNDENQNPFVTHNVEDGEDEMDIDEPIVPSKRRRAAASARTVPAKHSGPEQLIALSPPKIQSHFKVSKSAVEVYQDGKDEPTPKTPRHRDAPSRKVPITPRHRALAAGSQLTPKTPRAPGTPSDSWTAIYNQARQLFSRCSNPGRLVGRGAERQELLDFIERCMTSESAGCLYISGPPGTGKSALVGEICQQYRESENVKISVVNCMSVRSAKDLSGKLSEDLGLKKTAGFGYLQSYFARGKTRDSAKYFVVLDEVDELVDLDLALLYSLFEWSMQPSSRLILIGIANALDLTDRFLPRLQSRKLKPELLPFMPYSAAQITEVLTSKLKSLSTTDSASVPFLQPVAIQFCAKKVAAQTGDLRKAFDICQRAIALVERDTKETEATLILQDSPSKRPLMENINLSSPATPRSPKKSPLKATYAQAYTLETAPKATIAHMAKVTAQAFGNGTARRLSSLNLQQKAVLCALAALEKRKRDTQVERAIFATPSKHSNTAPSIKQLYETYTRLCKQENLFHPLTSVEFRDVVSGLETLSLLSAVDGKNGSFAAPLTPSKTPSRRGKGGFGLAASGDERRVASAVSMKELSGALEGPGVELLRDMLEGDIVL